MQMNILVIFTGGTIGSSIQEGFIVPNKHNKYKLIQMYNKATEDDQRFDVDMPYTMLSENLDGRYITKLMRCIDMHLRKGKYDGIIVTHGTDTLHYTAAGLSIVFEKTEIPIMLVSSNYPLEDERANGLYNFIHAVTYIRNRNVPGVYVSYKNRGEETKTFRADSIVNYDIYSDVIRTIEEEQLNEETPGKETGIGVRDAKANRVIPELQETSPVQFIRPYPGIRYEIPEDGTGAVLLGTYHSGTINTGSGELKKFCDIMRKKKIPVYVCGVPAGIGYESTKYYESLGIKVLPYGTDIYWYMRLWIELAH